MTKHKPLSDQTKALIDGLSAGAFDVAAIGEARWLVSKRSEPARPGRGPRGSGSARQVLHFHTEARDGDAALAGAQAALVNLAPLDPTVTIDSVLDREQGPQLGIQMATARRLRAEGRTGWADLHKALLPALARRSQRVMDLLAPFGVRAVDFHEGVLAELDLGYADLKQHEKLLVRWVPGLRHLRVRGVQSQKDWAQSLGIWVHLQSLSLRDCGLRDEDVAVLADIPAFKNLRRLDLSYNELTRASARAIAESKWLGGLEYLGFDGNEDLSPVDEAFVDPMTNEVIDWEPTVVGRELEQQVGRPLPWLHSPRAFATSYPPSPADVILGPYD